ncbi:hypothetical protein A2634_01735 [Candidatus Amesbacteria bacterium RIFCSPHIGHO2_01_FULL_48_32]|uniref:SH3b domain-containing protein n=1 Tax=Candidatus Amesbacteria bacterium RIFCSPLOWO2_01_FULL_48_25 TaxID=1797259 RepID=A0A1F4ZB35_9BACT|nr:MAG: hypothetical protein A2634_01735 [Candidatus Amesbacteria bacterium RIFCSPHIGHO2_01_FULL_48_32]OGD03381.1 MAG: hypothetical protein A2989_00935 [Candidatus Amesbacteria bacterium RIFCSPLOWO2_01_FULL_48_25]HJZ04998.1 PEGA domain-containing protein [Patescibacteria group bacterium]
MPKTKLIGLILIAAGLIIGVGFSVFAFIRSRTPTAGLKVFSTPPALVFIDNAQVGRTPLEKLFPPGEVTVKIIPDTLANVSPYQAKIRLTPDTYTVIHREFGETDDTSAGDITSLLGESGSEASLSIVTSYPDSASVTIDGQPQGFTPLLISPVTPGDHNITLSAPGFTDRQITAQAVASYRLALTVKLSGSPAPLPTPLPTASPATPSATLARPYVRILDTPTGFLRVRSEPKTTSSELGQVKPAATYPLLKSDSGWYLIKVDLPSTSSGLPAVGQGWVSSQYAQKYE